MKLYDQSSLSALAQGSIESSMVSKSGYMWKRGELNRAFQRRFFLLRANLLFYFEKSLAEKPNQEPIGLVVVENCTIELSDEEEEGWGDSSKHFAFRMAFHGDQRTQRTYVLATDSQESMESWMKALACCSYDYLRLMVQELEEQLRQLDYHDQEEGKEQEDGGHNGQEEAPQRPHRVNPFKKGSKANTFDSSTGNLKTSLHWRELHTSYGVGIMREWRQWNSGDKDNDKE